MIAFFDTSIHIPLLSGTLPLDTTPMEVLVATDFFTIEVWPKGGLVTYYIVFFPASGRRKVPVAGVTPPPHQS